MTLMQSLSKDEQERIHKELETSLVIKQLRKILTQKKETTLVNEESADSLFEIASTVGERRGYRTVLNLLPDPNGEQQ